MLNFLKERYIGIIVAVLLTIFACLNDHSIKWIYFFVVAAIIILPISYWWEKFELTKKIKAFLKK